VLELLLPSLWVSRSALQSPSGLELASACPLGLGSGCQSESALDSALAWALACKSESVLDWARASASALMSL
jgi:hypothetical protein